MRWALGTALACAAVFAILYGDTLTLPPRADDFIYLYYGRQGASVFVPHHFHFVHPLPALWFDLVGRFWPDHVAAIRLADALILLGTPALLYVFLVQIEAGERVAAVAAVTCVAFARHWEVTVDLAAVSELLASFFVLGALTAYVAWRKTRRRGWYAASLCALAAGLASKESAMVGPLLLTLADLLLCAQFVAAPRGRLLPLWLVSALVLAGDALAVQRSGMLLCSVSSPLDPRVWTQLAALSLDTFLPLPAVFALLYLGLIVWAWRRFPRSAFFCAWVPICWIPYSLVTIDPSHDRYTWFPSIGVCALVGMLANLRGQAAAAICAVILAANGWLARRAVEAYRQGAVPRAEVMRGVRTDDASRQYYVYSLPQSWHFPPFELALYGDIPLSRIHEWYDALRTPPPAGAQMLLWDGATRGFVDLTSQVLPPLSGTAHPTEWRPIAAWDFSTPTGWAVVEDGRTLASPELLADPWNVWSVEVDVQRAAAGPLSLGWSSDAEGGYGPLRAVTEFVPAGTSTAVFFPSSRPAFWTQGRVRSFFLTPVNGIEVLRVRVMGGLPPSELHPHL